MPSCLKRAVVSRAGCRRWTASMSFLFLRWDGISTAVTIYMGRDSLLYAREYLDDARDKAHDETDAGEGVEKYADAPHYAHRLTNLCGDLSSLGRLANACRSRISVTINGVYMPLNGPHPPRPKRPPQLRRRSRLQLHES